MLRGGGRAELVDLSDLQDLMHRFQVEAAGQLIIVA